jgi:class 3 adenylate cyclase
MTGTAERVSIVKMRSGVPADVVDRLVRTLLEAPEDDVHRMSPLRWALANDVTEAAAVELFVHATHAGLVEFSWGLLCPMCGAFLATEATLQALVSTRMCGLCGVPIPVAVDDNVEVAFTVSPSLRRIRFHDPAMLDMKKDGGPVFFSRSVLLTSKMHTAVQAQSRGAGVVPPGEHVVHIDLPADRYKIVFPSSHCSVSVDVQSEGAGEATVEVLGGRAIPDQVTVKAGRVALRVVNREPAAATWFLAVDPATGRYGVMEPSPPAPFLSGKRLLMSQAFRDLFRADSIPSGRGLELKSMAVLFTDLTGSTRLYSRVGDMRAYDLVREHFDVLRRIVADEGGAVVKTIGDAVMASFSNAEPAFLAALRMSDGVRRIGAGELSLKVGIHAGPCIAVELNDRLDYFGQTVNVAARVQALAEPDQIVTTEETFRAHGVRGVTERAGLHPAAEQAALKGLDVAVPVVRLSQAR